MNTSTTKGMQDNLYIPEIYLHEENREGFVVSSSMKRSWATKLKMITTIHCILSRYKIRWYADYGTLLGAVRHRGFVPWDDDFDISLMRQDYERALSILQAELPETYNVGKFGINQFGTPLSAINNRKNIDTGDNEDEAFITAQFFGNPYTDIIDVFPLDFVPADKEERAGFLDIYSMLLSASKDFFGAKKWGVLPQYAEQIKALTGQTVPADDGFLPAVCRLMSSLASMYSKEESVGVENIANMAEHSRERWRQYSWYEDIVWLPFEMIEVPVPSGYMDLLRNSHEII